MAQYIYTVHENPISLNDWYSAKHWTHRNKQKQIWQERFFPIIMNNKPSGVDQYKLKMLFNSRHDPSNVITMIKLFEDSLVSHGFLKSDTKKHCKGITIEPSEELPKKSFVIILESL
jgi:hypothetical protein